MVTGEDASEVSADQTCSFAVGSIVTPSLARIAATHSAAQARSDGSSIWASGCNETECSDPADRAPPRSCQSPPMAIAAVRMEPPKSNAKIWLLR